MQTSSQLHSKLLKQKYITENIETKRQKDKGQAGPRVYFEDRLGHKTELKQPAN